MTCPAQCTKVDGECVYRAVLFVIVYYIIINKGKLAMLLSSADTKLNLHIQPQAIGPYNVTVFLKLHPASLMACFFYHTLLESTLCDEPANLHSLAVPSP